MKLFLQVLTIFHLYHSINHYLGIDEAKGLAQFFSDFPFGITFTQSFPQPLLTLKAREIWIGGRRSKISKLETIGSVEFQVCSLCYDQ